MHPLIHSVIIPENESIQSPFKTNELHNSGITHRAPNKHRYKTRFVHMEQSTALEMHQHPTNHRHYSFACTSRGESNICRPVINPGLRMYQTFGKVRSSLDTSSIDLSAVWTNLLRYDEDRSFSLGLHKLQSHGDESTAFFPRPPWALWYWCWARLIDEMVFVVN